MPDDVSPDELSTEVEEAAEAGFADAGFTDDLIAANNFKTFLVGRGIEVPNELLSGLGEFVSRYHDDIRAHRGYVKNENRRRRKPWYSLVPVKPVSS
ncbi:MAG: hypothetical protein ACJ8EB_00710 [Allosphingosinicella sp.]